MSRKGIITVGAATVLVTLLAGTAAALANFSFTVGTVAGGYNFGRFSSYHLVPATVQIHAFTMKPGDSIPWHYHKATSYVILERGTLTERHETEPDQCVSLEFTGGTAFVEPPGEVHTVSNTGNDVAVIWWATVFPQSDGIQADGTYYVDSPCN